MIARMGRTSVERRARRAQRVGAEIAGDGDGDGGVY